MSPVIRDMHGRTHEIGTYGGEITGDETVEAPPAPFIQSETGDQPGLFDQTAIVIPVYCKPHHALRCLRSVHQHTDKRVWVIVVDDAGDSYTHQALEDEVAKMRLDPKRERSATLITNARNLKYTKSINRGMRAAFQVPRMGRPGWDDPRRLVHWAIALNSDTAVTEGWLERMLAAAQAGADVVCPYMSNAALLTLDMPPGAHYAEVARRLAAVSTKVRPPAVTPVGSCMMLSRRAWDVIVQKRGEDGQQQGGFDEVRSPDGYGEECHAWIDWLQAKLSCVVADDAYVEHKSHGTFRHEADDREKKAVQGFFATGQNRSTFDGQMARAQRVSPLPELKQRIRAVRTRPDDLHVAFYLPYIQLCGGALTLAHIASRLNDLGGFQASIAYQLAPEKDELAALPKNFTCVELKGSDPAKAWIGGGGFRDGFLVATTWSTGRAVKQVAGAHGLATAAFVQDREDQFVKPDGRAEYANPADYADYLDVLRGGRSVVNSGWVAQSLLADHGIAPGLHIPIGVDPDMFYPAPEKRSKKPRILAMHRPMTPRRGAGTLLKLYRTLSRKYGDKIELVTYGAGWIDEGYPVENLGVIDQDDLADEMRRAWEVVDPSSRQGWGMTAQEAMASACGVVTMRNGGIDNYGRHGVNCLIADDDSQLLAHVVHLIEDHELRERLGANGRRTALAYSWDVVTGMWAKALTGWRDLIKRA